MARQKPKRRSRLRKMVVAIALFVAFGVGVVSLELRSVSPFLPPLQSVPDSTR